nr:hypothetical protein [Myxococcota bacterium]
LVTYERGPLRTMLARRTDAAVDGFGVDEVFARDRRGHLLGAKSASGTLSFEHDARGRRLLDAREDAHGRVAVRHVYVGARLTSTSVQFTTPDGEDAGPRYVVRYHYPDPPSDTTRSRTKTMLVVDPTDQVHRVRRVDAGVLQRDFASSVRRCAASS